MKKSYKIEVDCANCAAKMETAVKKLDGVLNASVSFMAQKLTVETEADDQTDVMARIVKACKKVEPDCVIHI